VRGYIPVANPKFDHLYGFLLIHPSGEYSLFGTVKPSEFVLPAMELLDQPRPCM
jgi:hypothetical protein